MESKLQSEIIKWLKINDCYVIKVRAAPGVPVGCPDIVALCQQKWAVIEVKASDTAKFQEGQKATLQRLKYGNEFVYVATPETWPQIKDELIAKFL